MKIEFQTELGDDVRVGVKWGNSPAQPMVDVQHVVLIMSDHGGDENWDLEASLNEMEAIAVARALLHAASQMEDNRMLSHGSQDDAPLGHVMVPGFRVVGPVNPSDVEPSSLSFTEVLPPGNATTVVGESAMAPEGGSGQGDDEPSP